MTYLLHLAVLVLIYWMLVASLDLIAGRTGLLSFAQGAFAGVGAYGSALVSMGLGLHPFVAMCLAILLATVLSLVVSVPALRLHGDAFVIATFALQVIFTDVLRNWTALTGGPFGVRGVPPFSFLGKPLESPGSFLLIVLPVATAAFLVLNRISSSPFGLVLRSVREDEVLASALGKCVACAKLKAVAVSAGMASIAGAMYAHYIGFIDPSSFMFPVSILIVAMLVIGGPDSRWGPLVGAVALVLLPEVLRFLGLPAPVAAKVHRILFGGCLALLPLLRPQGILGSVVMKAPRP